MNLFEMLFYGIIPGAGQLLMRINKFGGSLDKPYLFFPLLLFPPFSFIPVLIAKFGYLNKTDGKNLIDIYVLIPIIFRFILIFIMGYISQIITSETGNLIIQIGLLFGTVLLGNILHILADKECEKMNVGFRSKLIKGMADSMLQYGAAMLAVYSSTFIPVLSDILEFLRSIPIPIFNNISSSIDSVFWSVGIAAGYLLMNMINVNYYEHTDICTGKIGIIRMIISIIAFATAVFFQFRNHLDNIISN